MIRVNAVFDIGKTNKKFFLFDEEYNEVHRDYVNLPLTVDEDDFETENLEILRNWIKETFDTILEDERFDIKTLNFSSYGASLVHLDYKGKPLTPLYNYTKEIPEEILEDFYKKYGDAITIGAETASPPSSGMLNSGMQLYWLKNTQPDIFAQIKYSLHLPQYLSYLFTGIPVSEYTSIGCHTTLWNYDEDDYHKWVHDEGIDKILPAIVPTSASINTTYNDKKIKIGVGIHDSSSALLPYILSKKKPFLLLSTGTWSIALNPFNAESLSKEDIDNNCLNYLRIDGKRVKASRFKFEGISLQRLPQETVLNQFDTFEEAYHQLMIELMELQIDTINKAIGNSKIKKIFIDGGFTDNDVFMKLMSHHFSSFKVLSTHSPLGSALGAAMVISDKQITSQFLKENYRMKKLVPLLF
jgi:L-fuculokinase